MFVCPSAVLSPQPHSGEGGKFYKKIIYFPKIQNKEHQPEHVTVGESDAVDRNVLHVQQSQQITGRYQNSQRRSNNNYLYDDIQCSTLVTNPTRPRNLMYHHNVTNNDNDNDNYRSQPYNIGLQQYSTRDRQQIVETTNKPTSRYNLWELEQIN